MTIGQTNTNSESMAWLGFSLLTVMTWGFYGLLLHAGNTKMQDPVNGRYKAFLWVGIAYFITAVLAPGIMLVARKASWNMPVNGMTLSLIAGVVGAIGAFGVLLAFGAKGSPAVVMAIVFAGAPVVNSVAAVLIYPPQGGIRGIQWPFFLGIVLAAAGGMLVTLYRPPPAKAHATAPIVQNDNKPASPQTN